jgi:hypothetical protein
MSAAVFFDVETGFPIEALRFWFALEMGQLPDDKLQACAAEKLLLCGRALGPCDLARAELQRRRGLS